MPMIAASTAARLLARAPRRPPCLRSRPAPSRRRRRRPSRSRAARRRAACRRASAAAPAAASPLRTSGSSASTTTVPTTRQICIAASSRLRQIPVIDDADDGGVGRRLGGIERKAASRPRTKNTSSPTPAPTESTATSVRPAGSPDAASGCSTSSLMPSRFASFTRRDDVADDAGELHAGSSP